MFPLARARAAVQDCSVPMKAFRTDCLVSAPIETCYQVLTDFENYSAWSSAHHKIISHGQDLKLYLRRENPNKPAPIILSAKIRQAIPPSHLAWGGGLAWAPWIVDVHHYFELQAVGEQTKFVHGERFRGILGHIYGVLRHDIQLKQYRRFNESFATRCQAVHAASQV